MLPRRITVVKTLAVIFTVGICFVTWLSNSDIKREKLQIDSNPELSSGLSRKLLIEKGPNVSLEVTNTSVEMKLREIIVPPSREGETLSEAIARTSKAFHNFYGSFSMKEQMEKVFSDEQKFYRSNPHSFQYLINAKSICNNSDVFMITFVHTSPDHYKQRMMIRETWGNTRNFPDKRVLVVFLMGKAPSKFAQDSLYLEGERYGDLVQEDYVDSYKNLTYKALSGLEWVSSYCPNAKFVLKTDDDIFINIFNLQSHLQSFVKHGVTSNMILCNVWTRMKVMRDTKSKWYISPEEFKDDYFSTYCSGSAYIMSSDAVKKMSENSHNTPFFWVDDYYVTGVLVKRSGIQHHRLNSVYYFKGDAVEQFIEGPKKEMLVFAHLHGLTKFYQMWESILSRESKTREHLKELIITKSAPAAR